jgi:hypothetical protein
MRLIGYGPGEIVDRISILSLKIQHGRLLARDVTHYQAEIWQLLPELNLKKATAEQVFELTAVNAVIWQLTDRVRAERANPAVNASRDSTVVLAQCAIQLQVANDRRTELISLININSGLEEKGPEKL